MFLSVMNRCKKIINTKSTLLSQQMIRRKNNNKKKWFSSSSSKTVAEEPVKKKGYWNSAEFWGTPTRSFGSKTP